jgi:hypothetical protein
MDWRLFGVVSVLAVALFAARAAWMVQGGSPLLSDTDDAMRMVVVRDFLSGQGWYDNVQHRLNTPFGAELHWSRLADLPLSGLILLFRPLFGADAETLAAVVLPLLLLLLLLYLCGRLTVKLAGAEALLPALVLPAFSLSVLGEFAPGRIDHHALQMLLLLTMLWCSIEALARPRFAVGAGLAAATALAIGIEGVPAVAAAILAFGLMWVSTPSRADALRGFGLSFALGVLGHLVLALPPGRWLTPACDALSFTYAVAAAAVGAAFLALSLLPVARPVMFRLGLGVGAGLAIAATLGAAFPACLSGPYSMLEPWLIEHWIDRITEAAPLWQSMAARPVYAIAVAVPPLLAVGVVLHAVSGRQFHRRRAEEEQTGDAPPPPKEQDRAVARGQWLVYLSFLALSVAAMLLQIRASRMATVVAVPAGAALIVAARQFYLVRPALARAIPLVLAWIGSAGLAVALVASGLVELIPGYAGSLAEPGLGGKSACLEPSAFAGLAGLPPARVMAPIDLGAHLLAFTPHEVVAAPYHRNAQGVRDAFDFFNGPIGDARAILAERGVTLVVVCPQMPEMRGLAEAAPDSFVRLYAEEALPGWLVQQSPPEAPLEVFAVADQIWAVNSPSLAAVARQHARPPRQQPGRQ